MTAMPHNFTFGDFRANIPAITVPTLILHGTEDKPAPIDATARRAHKLIPGSKLIEYEGHPHGFYATNSDQMIADTFDFSTVTPQHGCTASRVETSAALAARHCRRHSVVTVRLCSRFRLRQRSRRLCKARKRRHRTRPNCADKDIESP